MDSNLDRLIELERRKKNILQMGGVARIEAQHRAGKLTARERIGKLFEPGSFHELDSLVKHRCAIFGMDEVDIPADAVVTGFGDS